MAGAREASAGGRLLPARLRGDGEEASRTLEPSWRCCSQRVRGQRLAPPGSGCPSGPHSPGVEVGPESPGAGASRAPAPDWPPPRSLAGRSEIGRARGRSGVPDPGRPIAVPEPRGWRGHQIPSPRCESGREARTMPYVLISTQIRMVSTRLASGVGAAGPRGCGRTWAPPSWAAPAEQGRKVSGHTPSGLGEGGWDPTLPRSRNS